MAVPSGTDEVPSNKLAPLFLPHVLPKYLELDTLLTLSLSALSPPPIATIAELLSSIVNS